MILAGTRDDRVITWTSLRLTETRTHAQTQATTIPEGHNWPRVKIDLLHHPARALHNVTNESSQKRFSDDLDPTICDDLMEFPQNVSKPFLNCTTPQVMTCDLKIESS